MNHSISRRSFLTGAVAALGGTALAVATAGTAHAAPGPIRGTVIDFAAGVPSAQSIKNAGHLGSVRYVSRRRPGTESWMTGKPVTAAETHTAGAAGLFTASVYQFGKDATADWKEGAAGAAVHVPQAIALHVAAGGPTRRPIYMAIDDNPTHQQYDTQIRSYLQASAAALNAAGYQLGIYGNYNVIDWAIADGLGEFFWQHDWGSQGRIHPRTTIHQKAGYQRVIDGVTVDVNNVYASNWGQWLPGVAHRQPQFMFQRQDLHQRLLRCRYRILLLFKTSSRICHHYRLVCLRWIRSSAIFLNCLASRDTNVA